MNDIENFMNNQDSHLDEKQQELAKSESRVIELIRSSFSQPTSSCDEIDVSDKDVDEKLDPFKTECLELDDDANKKFSNMFRTSSKSSLSEAQPNDIPHCDPATDTQNRQDVNQVDHQNEDEEVIMELDVVQALPDGETTLPNNVLVENTSTTPRHDIPSIDMNGSEIIVAIPYPDVPFIRATSHQIFQSERVIGYLLFIIIIALLPQLDPLILTPLLIVIDAFWDRYPFIVDVPIQVAAPIVEPTLEENNELLDAIMDTLLLDDDARDQLIDLYTSFPNDGDRFDLVAGLINLIDGSPPLPMNVYLPTTNQVIPRIVNEFFNNSMDIYSIVLLHWTLRFSFYQPNTTALLFAVARPMNMFLIDRGLLRTNAFMIGGFDLFNHRVLLAIPDGLNIDRDVIDAPILLIHPDGSWEYVSYAGEQLLAEGDQWQDPTLLRS